MKRWPIFKAKELLNWQPEHNLKDWIESNKNNSNIYSIKFP